MDPEELRDHCLSLPFATEDVKWGNDLCFCVGGKMFCVTGIDGGGKVSFKTTPEKFSELTERHGVIPAPYVARYHWVAVERTDAIADNELKELIALAYKLVYDKLPKKVRTELSADHT